MDIYEEILGIIKPLLDDMNVELVELQYNRSKRSSVRIFVWQDGGISLDTCTEISRQMSDLLDRKDIIDGTYTLEVSSPGVDRPLVTRRDFQRQIGRKAKVISKSNDKTKTVHGRILSADDAHVVLDVDKKQQSIQLDEIVSAKVLVEF